MFWPAAVARLELALYPELEKLAPRDRPLARTTAAREPFDLIEWCGLLLAIAVATIWTRYAGSGLDVVQRVAALALNAAVAVPILGLLAGPFLIRRTRRGLARIIRERSVR